MKLLPVFAFAILSAVSVLSDTAYADNDGYDDIEHQLYTDVVFVRNEQRAVNDLRKRGYIVQEVDVEVHRGRPILLQIEAYKNGQKYEIIVEYPSLKVIRFKTKDN